MRPSLATDLLSWLLTYISFVVDHRWTFRSIIDNAIDSIDIGRRIFSVNHSGCPVFTTPSTSGSARMRDTVPYVLARDFKTSKTSGESRRNCRAEYGIVTWRTIYSNANSTHFDLFSSEHRYIFCERCRSALCLQSDSTSPSDERWHSQQHWALAGRTADVAGSMWPASPPGSNRYFKTTWKQIIH